VVPVVAFVVKANVTGAATERNSSRRPTDHHASRTTTTTATTTTNDASKKKGLDLVELEHRREQREQDDPRARRDLDELGEHLGPVRRPVDLVTVTSSS
jgi:hypothetical protein